MRRALTTLLAAALPVALLAFAPAAEEPTDESTSAEETTATEEEVLPEPVEVSMFLHGLDDGQAFVDETDPLGNGAAMDRTAPEGDFDSKQLLNYGVGPNPNCTGNGLLPTWSGFVGAGTIVGDATVTFDVVASAPGSVTVELWADQSPGACNEAYVEPDVSVDVALPAGAGTVEAVLPTDGLDPDFSFLLVLKPTESGPVSFTPEHQARILYDGADYPASLTFTCQPDALEEGETAEDADCLPF